MNKSSRKKIKLNREVLRNLSSEQAQLAAGGAERPSKDPIACRVGVPKPSDNPAAC